jgi:UDP-N-acetylglucosamine diphosphorylase/glucosamine-1-phosphate N-acetyltransferase
MRVCLFEDALVADLEPLTLTRPAYDLLCGCATLADKQRRFFAATESAALVRPHLAATSAGRVNDLGWLRSAPVVLVNARWLPPAPEPDLSLRPDRPCVALCQGEVAVAVLTPDLLADCSPLTIDACLERWAGSLPSRPVAGTMVRYLWDLVDRNGDEIELDTWLTSPERPRRTENLPPLVGRADRLLIDPSARIDPMVVADTTAGPVVIDRDAVVGAFTRLEGPCYVGPGTQVLGAKVRAGTSLGPQCRVGGEVECSVVWGYSNKYHDGFLGHAYIGAWVNLGAGTSNSDLRNDYGDVRVVVGGRLIDTRRPKVGCFIGDHTKTGLGALLNTGTNVGAFCNVLPTGGLLPKYVPSFTDVWNGMLKDNADLDSLWTTAAKVMRRRGVALDEACARLYRQVWEQTAAGRRQAIREAEARRLRKSA